MENRPRETIKKISREKSSIYSSTLSEALEPNLEAMYNVAISKLRKNFSTIPEDLTNKFVNIRYKEDNGVYQKIFLYSDGLVVDKINGKNIVINKIKGKRNGFALSKNYNHYRGYISINKELLKSYEFNRGINRIIENADKCEIIVQELERPKFPVDE